MHLTQTAGGGPRQRRRRRGRGGKRVGVVTVVGRGGAEQRRVAITSPSVPPRRGPAMRLRFAPLFCLLLPLAAAADEPGDVAVGGESRPTAMRLDEARKLL